MKLSLKKPMPTDLAKRLPQALAAASSWTLQQLAALQAAAAEALGNLLRPPTSLADYVKAGDVYVAKRLLARLACLLVALAALFVFYIHPYLEQRFWMPTLVLDSAKYRLYSGAAEVVDRAGTLLYRGALQNGVASGRGALYENGRLLYEGAFRDNRYEGRGVLYQSGARLYDGAFKDNRRDGPGTAYYPSGRRKYQGDFADDCYEGSGALYADDEANTLLYRGAFARGVYSGPGKQFAAGKLRYAGTFADGVYSGEGKLYDAQERLLYEGGFADGRFSGEGKLYAAAGQLLYEGGFSRGSYEKIGRLYDRQSGRLLYEGAFSGGLYSGEGTLYSAAGRPVYQGRFFRGAIDFAALLGASPDRVRQIFGREDDLALRERDFLLFYRRSQTAFAFRFAQNGAPPALQRILCADPQTLGLAKTGATAAALKSTLPDAPHEALAAAPTAAEQDLLNRFGKDAPPSLYRLRWQDADVRYAACAAAPESVVLYCEMEGIE